MTTLSVWQIDSAHCSANCVSCGVAFREAKNATNSLSSKSLFPDKSIKKRRRCINLSLIKALAAHYKNKQHKHPRREYIAQTEPIGRRDIYTKRGYLVAALLVVKNRQVSCRRYVKKYPIELCMAERHRPSALTKIRKILRYRQQKNDQSRSKS